MSDSAAPVAESSAPQSSRDIVASVVESAEAADTGSETPSASPDPPARLDTTSATETPSPQPTPAEMSASAKFLLAQGHKPKTVDGRDAWLKVKTVEAMLERYADQHAQTWQTERSTLSDKATKAEQLEGFVNAFRESLRGDPRAFLSELASHDPRYRSFLEQQQAAREEPAVDDKMPEPDYDLGNGQRTYSLEGLKQRDAWLERQMLKKMDDRLKPLTERESQMKAEQARRELQDKLHTRTGKQMQDAQSWAMFGALAADGSLTPFQDEVLAELRKDREASERAGERPTMSLRQAYLEVFNRHQEPDKVRERVMADLNKAAPLPPALGRHTADTTKTPGPRSSREIVRETIERLERQNP